MPINVASGAVHFDKQDIRITGRFTLHWGRSYHSGLTGDMDSPFGQGWTNVCFAKLTRSGKDYRFQSPSGSIIQFPDPDDSVERQGTIRDLGSFHEISRQGFQLRVTQWGLDGSITRYHFQPERNGQWWPLRSVEDATGNGLELAWDEQGRLKGLRQKLEKRTLAVSYTTGGRIASVAFRYPDGRQQILARYDYDPNGRLSAAIDAQGFSERYEYDPSGRISREIAKDGGILTFKYDDKGRCIRLCGLDNYNLKVLKYLDHIQWTEVKNSIGNTTRYQWLASGQVTLEMSPSGGKTETSYDEHGRIISKVGPLGDKTEFVFDGDGNRSKIIDALGQETSFKYNASHLPVEYVDTAGGSWKKVYDEANRVVCASDPAGSKWTVEYDKSGNAVTIERPDGATRKQRYAESGRLEETTDWEGRKASFIHDEFGRTVLRRDPDGSTTSFEYDLSGRPLKIASSGGKSVVYAYNAAGNAVRMDKSGETPIHYRYGTCRRLLERKDGAGNAIRYTWGTEPDRLETVFNEIGEAYRFTYDAAERVSMETGFDGRKTVFKYDLSGRCIEKTNGLGQRISFKHDLLGRIVEEDAEGDEPSVFTYDKHGNLATAANSWGSLVFERDDLGRVISESQDGFKILRRYDPLGKVLGLESDAGIEFEYTYDKNGLVAGIDANGLGRYAFERNERSQISARTLPGGLRLENAYDSRGRLLKQAISGPGMDPLQPLTIVKRDYAYGESDLLHSIEDGLWGKSTYSHDEARRLVQFATAEGQTAFRLAPTGDIESTRSNADSEVTFAYGPGGRLVRQGESDYFYDAAGRLVLKSTIDRFGSRSECTYSWDAKDRLRSFKSAEGTFWEYTYDPLGRRSSKKGPEKEIRYIWDESVLLHEMEKNGKTVTWGFDPHSFKPLLKIDGGSLLSIIHDHLGTPREMLDAKGKIVWATRFDPWGNPIAGKGRLDDCPFRFQGQYFDGESGLHYNRFRYYDPKVARFISQDPARLTGGISAYQYVHNPLHWIDPLGLCGEEEKPAETTFRGERSSNDPEKVFQEGLKSKGDNMDLLRHCEGNKPDTGYLSSSQDIGIAEGFAGKNGYVYEIETNKGINANETLGSASPFPEQKEVSVPTAIQPGEIKGAYPVKGGKMTGEYIPNPNFGGG
ncbi:MAG: hypothetical protein JWP91_3025 [Fibrobacteres bacterium]|nr:hypothetical protein [Fibrobacterota bacterium]